MSREVINPESQQRQTDAFHFSAAARAAGIVFCSGQIGSGPEGIPESAEEEFRNAWNQIGNVLNEAGLSYENIVEYTSYHVNMHDHLGTFMKIRDEFISAPWPAWTAIGCTELAMQGARVEIRVTAN